MKWDYLGNEWAVNLLQDHLRRGHTRHAYLFTGPEGVGRRTLALRFAQALNCSQAPQPGQFCGECRDCRQIERMEHPDLSIVQAAEGGSTLKVEQIRELRRSLSLAPYQGAYRVAVLQRFEQANPSAANALLKTLEEPPAHVILILTAESPEILLPTIVSRCEVLRLKPVSLEVIRVDLEGQPGVSPDRASLIARLTGGCPGAARRLVTDPTRLDQRREWLDDLIRLLGAGRLERYAYAQKLTRDRVHLQEVLQVWTSFWHDVLLQAGGVEAAPANLDRAAEIEALAARLELSGAYHAVHALDRTLRLVESNVNNRLATEVLMLDLPRLS